MNDEIMIDIAIEKLHPLIGNTILTDLRKGEFEIPDMIWDIIPDWVNYVIFSHPNQLTKPFFIFLSTIEIGIAGKVKIEGHALGEFSPGHMWHSYGGIISKRPTHDHNQENIATKLENYVNSIKEDKKAILYKSIDDLINRMIINKYTSIPFPASIGISPSMIDGYIKENKIAHLIKYENYKLILLVK